MKEITTVFKNARARMQGFEGELRHIETPNIMKAIVFANAIKLNELYLYPSAPEHRVELSGGVSNTFEMT